MYASWFKTFVFASLTLSCASPIETKGIYSFFDKLGSLTDWAATRGKLDEKYEKMFNEVAGSLGISEREIKLRNAGIFLRLFYGYNNAMGVEYTNRVYMNEDCLREMKDEEVRYLMAHELSHHRNHDVDVFLAASLVIGMSQQFVTRTALQNGLLKGFPMRDGRFFVTTDSGLANMYMTSGVMIAKIFPLSVWQLAQGQIHQYCETRADTQAVTIAGIDPEHGAGLMKHLYNPDTKNWPLYGRLSSIIAKVLLKVGSLPILKQHANHLMSYEDRVAHILSLKKLADQKINHKGGPCSPFMIKDRYFLVIILQ